MNIMYGDADAEAATAAATVTRIKYVPNYADYYATVSSKIGSGLEVATYSVADFALVTSVLTNSTAPYYVEETYESLADTTIIKVTAANFPGTYRLVGDTMARNQATGKDEFFQFIVPLAKMSAENTFTLEAEGDPTVNINAVVKVA